MIRSFTSIHRAFLSWQAIDRGELENDRECMIPSHQYPQEICETAGILKSPHPRGTLGTIGLYNHVQLSVAAAPSVRSQNTHGSYFSLRSVRSPCVPVWGAHHDHHHPFDSRAEDVAGSWRWAEAGSCSTFPVPSRPSKAGREKRTAAHQQYDGLRHNLMHSRARPVALVTREPSRHPLRGVICRYR